MSDTIYMNKAVGLHHLNGLHADGSGQIFRTGVAMDLAFDGKTIEVQLEPPVLASHKLDKGSSRDERRGFKHGTACYREVVIASQESSCQLGVTQ